jgi:hypothetical protein
MAWCASSQLGWFGECRVRFFYRVLPRCAVCPLFDVERAVLDVLGENTPQTIEPTCRRGPTDSPSPVEGASWVRRVCA